MRGTLEYLSITKHMSRVHDILDSSNLLDEMNIHTSATLRAYQPRYLTSYIHHTTTSVSLDTLMVMNSSCFR